MSLNMQLSAALLDAQRLLDMQLPIMQSYLTKLDNTLKTIDNVLSGSNNNYDKEMIEKAVETKKQIEDTIKSVNLAKSKIEEKRMKL